MAFNGLGLAICFAASAVFKLPSEISGPGSSQSLFPPLFRFASGRPVV